MGNKDLLATDVLFPGELLKQRKLLQEQWNGILKFLHPAGTGGNPECIGAKWMGGQEMADWEKRHGREGSTFIHGLMGFTCDGCKEEKKEKARLGCPACNWDLCWDCVKKSGVLSPNWTIQISACQKLKKKSKKTRLTFWTERATKMRKEYEKQVRELNIRRKKEVRITPEAWVQKRKRRRRLLQRLYGAGLNKSEGTR